MCELMKYRVYFHCCPHGIWRHCSEVVTAKNATAAKLKVSRMKFGMMVSFAKAEVELYKERFHDFDLAA